MMKSKLQHSIRMLCATLAVSAGALSATTAAQAEELTVYGAMAKGHFADLIATFQAQEPDLKINQLLDSNGPIIARLLAEEANPRADVILGASVPGLVMLEERGMLEPYAP